MSESPQRSQGEVTMVLAEIIFIIIIGLIIYKVIDSYLQQKTFAAQTVEQNQQLQQELDDIKARLRNLESIVIDDDFDIKRKMKDL
ncbi:hypothetical protein L9G74_17470 [Shewanella sp. C32]|uniref:Phage shock protein B n=1 Tax=Shewanella electrica TaxID=515560 RepID=A0ABT2FPI2_9GAMM|nr:hypothetical protein [Shewanella electrica]MCH1926611.1 hypothetical protein [Shewanella electrica]MCS4558232.1 hypothetical protein [Shewanella electrica]